VGVPARRRGSEQLPESAFAPERLDSPVVGAVAALTKAVELWARLEPKVSKFLAEFDPDAELGEKETGADRAGKVLGLLEKLSKVVMNLTKSVDEASRLRNFLAGGPDSRTETKDMSDVELMDVIVNVAVARGLWRAIRARAKDAGVLEAEIVPDGPA
jgi:hypothetical protein